MTLLQELVSPDGGLVLRIEIADDGTHVVGFKGGSWHTHPDILAGWLGVPEHEAVSLFVRYLTTDRLPILMSVDQGQTIDPWVSDNLAGTVEAHGAENCVLRKWSGMSLRPESAA